MTSILHDPVHIKAAQVAADRIKAKYGFYCWPSATLAQAQLESAGWTAISGTNNGFGIKATPAHIKAGQYTMCKTREVINGRSVIIDAPFANFASLADAYEAHAMLFVRVKLYAAAIKAPTARQFVIEMAHYYATSEKEKDPTKRYSYILLKMMDQNNLYQYDKIQSVISATTVPIKPPVAKVAPAKASGSSAVVVASAGAGISLFNGEFSPIVIGIGVALAASIFAFYLYQKAKSHIAEIPATADIPVNPPASTEGVKS